VVCRHQNVERTLLVGIFPEYDFFSKTLLISHTTAFDLKLIMEEPVNNL
jgi:hypothetical protein